MNPQAPTRATRRTRPPVALRVSPVALACVSLLTATQLAQAQDAAAVQTVTVTGIRRGIESSVSVKRNADGIMEVISSEDLGKLPEVSIAESLARLPGLAGQAVGGRIKEIQIRGLSGDFAGTLLNGRQQVSTGDNRSVEFDQFPSELIGQVRIYKTPDAKIVGGGLSGTIDMRTVRPLDFGERAVALNARMEKNSNGKLNADTSVTGNRLSASYIDQFADRTVGVALGFAHLDTPTQELHYKAWGFSGPVRDCTTHPEWGCSKAEGIPPGATFLNGFEAQANSRKQIRDGAMGVFEFKPNKDLHSTVDLYYSKFSKDESSRGLMGGLGDAWGGAPGNVFTNVKTQPVGSSTTLVTEATISGVANMVVRNDVNTRDDKLKSAGWNTEYKIGDGWSTSADLSYSNAKRKENVIETYAGAFTGSAKAVGNFDVVIPTAFGIPTFKPSLDYTSVTDVRLSDPAGWGHDGLWKKPKVDDTIKAANLAGKKELGGAFSALDFGLNYTKRTKAREMNELAANLKNGRAPIAVPNEFLQRPTSLSFAGIPGVLAYDVLGALGSIYDLEEQARDQIFNRNYSVYEKVTTAYSQLGIDTDLANLPLRGNLGVQYIHTKQGSTGFTKLGGVDTAFSSGASYNDFLPSLNLSLELPSDIYVRLGLAKTLARGRIDDMKAGSDVSIKAGSAPGAPTTWSGSGGNPQLEPWRAKSADLSLEKYWGKRSYVSAAGFYKKLDTYIFKQRLPFDFSVFPNTTNLPTPPQSIEDFERPANGKGGDLWGGEFTASLDAGTWSTTLDGFGASVNYTTISTNIKPEGPGTSLRLPGLSGTSTNITLYYEKSGFSARISQRYRSSFRGEVTALHNARSFEEIQASKQVDLQTGYEFQSGSLKGLSVLFQVNNLNNEPYRTKQGNGFGDVIAPAITNTFGRQYLFGVNYKL